MAADYLGRKSRVALKWKTTLGTSSDITAGDYLTAVLLIDPAQMKSTPAITREEMQLTSATGLTVERARSITDYTSGLHRFGFGGVAIQDTLPYLFFMALMKMTETEVTAPTPDYYQHAFIPWADAGIPDFTDPWDPTATASPNTKPPLVSIYYDWLQTAQGGTVLNDALLNSLVFSVNVNNSGVARFANITGEFIGGAISENFDSGSVSFPSKPTETVYNNATAFTLTLAGTVSYSGCFKSYSLSINNNITSDCRTTGGRANNFRIAPEYMVDFTIPCNDTTDTLASGLLAGTEQTITLSTGTTQNLGYMNIVAKGALVGNLERMLENNVWVYKGQLKCELPSSGNSLAVTVCTLTQLIPN